MRVDPTPLRDYGRVTVHARPGRGNRRIIDTRYAVRVDDSPWPNVSDWPTLESAAAFALGLAQGLDAGSAAPRGRRCTVCGGQRPPYHYGRALPFCNQADHWEADRA